MEAISYMPVIRVTGNLIEEINDTIAMEIPFTLIVNGETLVSLLCSPSDLDHMAIGFLFSEGLLADRDSIADIQISEKISTVSVTLANLPKNWQSNFHKKTITSGCGKGITFTDPNKLQDLPANRSPIQLSTEQVRNFLSAFRNQSKSYLKTGGIHSAALANETGILLFAEDIGRHNAVDKLIGRAILERIPLTDKILLSSGRISGEIMTKVIRSKIPCLISRTAPTCMSISYAENHGVTLIGFARGNRMNIYTHPQGVVFNNLIEHSNIPEKTGSS